MIFPSSMTSLARVVSEINSRLGRGKVRENGTHNINDSTNDFWWMESIESERETSETQTAVEHETLCKVVEQKPVECPTEQRK